MDADYTGLAAKIKEVRDRTQCPLMACRQAVIASKGNVEEAIEFLRKAAHDTRFKLINWRKN